MNVYYRGRGQSHHIHIQPGTEFPLVSAWREVDGRSKSYDIHFINGVADVEENIGQYLIDKGLASKTEIITSMSEVA